MKFIHHENPLELIWGFRLLHDTNPKSVLILVGAGPMEEEMIALILKTGLPNVVRLVGYAKYSELPRSNGDPRDCVRFAGSPSATTRIEHLRRLSWMDEGTF